MKAALFGALCALSALATSQPVKEVFTQAVASPNLAIPAFRHGYLMIRPGFDLAEFSVYAPDGRFAYDKFVELSEGDGRLSVAQVSDVDFDAEGNAALAAAAGGITQCKLRGVLLLDQTGRQTGFIDTGCYLPAHIAFAPDHSIWTVGMELDSAGMEDRQDYMVVRHFSLDGKQLKATLPRSSFPKGLAPGATFIGAPGILVTADRIGVLVYSGMSGKYREWIELDPDGEIVERLRVDVPSPFVAFTADDHVYLQGGGPHEFLTLDAASHTWKSALKQGGSLMGADGNKLVFSKSGPGPVQLEWFNRP